MNDRPEISITRRQRWLRTLLAIIVVALFVLVGNRYLGEVHRIAQANWIGVIGMILVYVITVWIQSRTIRIGLEAFDHKISERESFSLFVLASAVNLVLPRSGIGSTALYLSRVRRISLFDYSSVVLYNVGLFVFCSSLFGIFAFGTYGFITRELPPPLLIGVIPAALLASGLAISVQWTFPQNWTFPGVALARKLVRATRRMNGSPEMWRMGRMHLLLVILRALRLQIAFWAMGVPVGFLPVLMASVLGDLLFVIAVTPGAIGFRETAIVMAATWLGTTVPIALAVALLDRLVFSLTVVVLTPFAWRSLFRGPPENSTLATGLSASESLSVDDKSKIRIAMPEPKITSVNFPQGARS